MAELADAHGSGPCESNFMQVQLLLSAPKKSGVEIFRVSAPFFVVYYIITSLLIMINRSSENILKSKYIAAYSFYCCYHKQICIYF